MCYEISVEVLNGEDWYLCRGRANPVIMGGGSLTLSPMGRNVESLHYHNGNWRNLTVLDAVGCTRLDGSTNFDFPAEKHKIGSGDANAVESKLSQVTSLLNDSIVQLEVEIAFMIHALQWARGGDDPDTNDVEAGPEQ